MMVFKYLNAKIKGIDKKVPAQHSTATEHDI
jgi:hypothetical protein